MPVASALYGRLGVHVLADPLDVRVVLGYLGVHLLGGLLQVAGARSVPAPVE